MRSIDSIHVMSPPGLASALRQTMPRRRRRDGANHPNATRRRRETEEPSPPAMHGCRRLEGAAARVKLSEAEASCLTQINFLLSHLARVQLLAQSNGRRQDQRTRH